MSVSLQMSWDSVSASGSTKERALQGFGAECLACVRVTVIPHYSQLNITVAFREQTAQSQS